MPQKYNLNAALVLLGRKYLNKKRQEALECAINDGELLVAQLMLMKAIDTAWFFNKVSFEEAALDHRRLALHPETARKARQIDPSNWI